MATDEWKYQAIRDDEADAPGSWTEVVHDCLTPGLGEIQARKAAVGSIWTCNCGDRWKLLNHKKNSEFSIMNPALLVWRRITPKDED